jgi:hypothetical protein
MGFSPESYTFMTMGRLTLESIEHRASELRAAERTVDARPSILRTRLVPSKIIRR